MGRNKNKKKNNDQSGPASIQDDIGEMEHTFGAMALSCIITDCEICREKYDTSSRKPRNLQCGHSFCTKCCKKLLRINAITCPKCRKKTSVSNMEYLAVNYPVLDIITSSVINDATTNQNKESASQKSEEISPHGGKCLEAQAEIAMHCAHCDLWLCEDCSHIDHKGMQCFLMPYQDTLREMRQASLAKVTYTEKSLDEFSREVKVYDGKLRSCTYLMEILLDCVKREQSSLALLRESSQKMKQELCDLRLKKPLSDLEEALVFLDGMETATSAMHTWTTGASAILKEDQVFRLSKTLLQTAELMHVNNGTQTNGGLMAVHNIKGVDVTFSVEKDGGRLLVHAGDTQNQPLQAGCRLIKLNHIKSCIDPSSALTFLDISLRGQVMGRVFIRLLGCTKRSQCFLMMCTGETGTSFLDTCFHRIWWSNLDGEHVWTGDYDRGDGSGGTLPNEIIQGTKDLPEKKTQVAITEGLVAGRYGKCNNSIFRLYTKSSKTLEEAAFGRVEFGLNILKDALEYKKNITEITISGCGVVVEP